MIYPGAVVGMNHRLPLGVAVGHVRIGGVVTGHIGVGGIIGVQMGVTPQQLLASFFREGRRYCSTGR